MSEEKLNATGEKIVGSVKETAGKITGDKNLETEGIVENLAGKAKEVAADIKDTVEGALEGVENALKDDKSE